MIDVPRTKGASALILAFSLILLLAGCSPLYMWDTHLTATPRPESLTVAELSRAPLATLGPIAPAYIRWSTPNLRSFVDNRPDLRITTLQALVNRDLIRKLETMLS